MFLIASAKHLPKELTSYDLLKSFAVITMIVDHIGLYLFPEQNEWRMVGRMSMPVWLFLIGYARSRELSSLLWIGGSILIVSEIIIGGNILSLNILFTILLVRFLLDGVMQAFLKDKEAMLWTMFSMVVLVFPTSLLFDYGTQAFLFAMFGYLVRHKNELSVPNHYILIFMGLVVIVHSFFQQIMFGFSEIESIFSAMGVLIASLYMTNFKLQLYPVLTKRLPLGITGFFKLMGRHSLEIYVVHLLVLQAIALPLYPERFGWFQWTWF